jgi:hypothetical protein
LRKPPCLGRAVASLLRADLIHFTMPTQHSAKAVAMPNKFPLSSIFALELLITGALLLALAFR